MQQGSCLSASDRSCDRATGAEIEQHLRDAGIRDPTDEQVNAYTRHLSQNADV